MISMTISISKLKYFFISFAFFSCQKQQECNSKEFKTGKFIFTQESNGKKESTTFERTDKLQIETYKGRTDTASVRWVNDYEFVLQKLHPRNMAERKAISMRILTTKDKTYTFEYSFVGESKKQIGTVTKTN
jgi:hypothetical protein